MLNPVRPSLAALVTGALLGASVTYLAGRTSPGRSILGFDAAINQLHANVAKLEERLAKEQKQFGDVIDGMHAPAMHIKNEADKYVLTVNIDIGDTKLEDLQINVQGQTLTIAGTKVVQTEHSYSASSFSESLAMLPRDIDADHATYEYDEDKKVLVVTLPKLGKGHLASKTLHRTWQTAGRHEPAGPQAPSWAHTIGSEQ